jgi:5-(aminomethyl)-3-furanmethanol phosphate kinase
MDRPTSVTVVKLGGSFAYEGELKDWLAALATCAGRVVLVPGGGPFADTVRDAQPRMGFDEPTAHRMALLAMELYGIALAGLGTDLRLAASVVDIRHALRDAVIPVWTPTAMVLEADDIPATWEVTSDSLAAWLAGRIGAMRVLLVKQTGSLAEAVDPEELAAKGIVDPAFPRFLRASGAAAVLAGPADHAAAAAAIRNAELGSLGSPPVR